MKVWYSAEDGTAFDSANACRKYEAQLKEGRHHTDTAMLHPLLQTLIEEALQLAAASHTEESKAAIEEALRVAIENLREAWME